MLDSEYLRSVHERVLIEKEAGTFKWRRDGDDQDSFYSYSLPFIAIRRLTTTDYNRWFRSPQLNIKSRIIWLFQESLDSATATNGGPDTCPAPRVHDVIVDSSGVEYSIDYLELKLLDGAYRCLAQPAVS